MTAFVKLGSCIGPNRHRIMLSIVKFVHDTMVLPSDEYVSCTKCRRANMRSIAVVSKDGAIVKVAVLG